MNAREFLFELLQPGETIVVAGRRGHGKTATVMSMAQHAVEGDYGHDKVEIITNIVFGRVRRGGQDQERASRYRSCPAGSRCRRRGTR